MFDSLTEKLASVFKKVRGVGKLTEKNIQEAIRDVRMALLEADVNFNVVKTFIASVKERGIGSEVLESLTPGQQFIKIVHEELIRTMGESNVGLSLSGKPPAIIMLVGLHGCGKTTTAGKLALHLKKKGRHPYLVPADIKRPAAIEQLTRLGEQLGIPVHGTRKQDEPVQVCREAVDQASARSLDTVIIDTAGRLHIDEDLMGEVEAVKAAVAPREILFVADAMTGQDSVNVARSFNERLQMDGVILTKLDGDARGGAALSIRSVTGKPIKFIGVGEKLDALEAFHPDRMASRILGMGDILTFVEKAEAMIDEKQALELEEKLRKDAFTLEDFRDQMCQIRKMGSIDELLGMIPGMGKMMKGVPDLQAGEKEMVKVEAIINSMTNEERRNHLILNGSRRKRIARGSGTTVQDVNRLVKQYGQARQMIKKMNRLGARGMKQGLFPGM